MALRSKTTARSRIDKESTLYEDQRGVELSDDQVSLWKRVLWSALCGILFGWLLQKSSVYKPDVIFRQMKMEQFTMMKTFLSAVATTQLVLTLFYLVRKAEFDLSCQSYNHGQPRGIFSTALGAALLGAGMAVAGACPGTVMVQIGTGLPYSGVVFAGGVTGCLAYIILEPVLSQHLLPIWTLNCQKQCLSKWSGISRWKIAVPLAFSLAAIVVTLEVFLPYDIDYPYSECHGYSECYRYTAGNSTQSTNELVGPIPVYLAPTWPPYWTGIGIGLLQIPLVIVMQDTIGSSSAWIASIANVVYLIAPSLAKKSNYLMRSKDGMGNYWQVIYLASAIIGAMLSDLSSNTLTNPKPPIDGFNNPVRSFFGGFLILFGARLAGGCTSGHGVSGFGLLYTSSVIAVAFMFSGGIFTAFAIDSFSYGGSFFRVP